MSEWTVKGNIKAAIAMNNNASTILAIGPAIPILPAISSETFAGLVRISPRNAKTIPMNAVTNAISSPIGHNLNSASQPHHTAANFCPNSRNMNPIPTPTRTIGKIETIP